MSLFTPLNAKEMAARSVAARKAAEAERAVKRAASPLPNGPQTEIGLGIDVACMRERLESLDRLMARAKTDREWDNLSRAYERLFRIWMVLTKTPGPGNRKPAPERSRPTKPSSPCLDE